MSARWSVPERQFEVQPISGSLRVMSKLRRPFVQDSSTPCQTLTGWEGSSTEDLPIPSDRCEVGGHALIYTRCTTTMKNKVQKSLSSHLRAQGVAVPPHCRCAVLQIIPGDCWKSCNANKRLDSTTRYLFVTYNFFYICTIRTMVSEIHAPSSMMQGSSTYTVIGLLLLGTSALSCRCKKHFKRLFDYKGQHVTCASLQRQRFLIPFCSLQLSSRAGSCGCGRTHQTRLCLLAYPSSGCRSEGDMIWSGADIYTTFSRFVPLRAAVSYFWPNHMHLSGLQGATASSEIKMVQANGFQGLKCKVVPRKTAPLQQVFSLRQVSPSLRLGPNLPMQCPSRGCSLLCPVSTMSMLYLKYPKLFFSHGYSINNIKTRRAAD